MAVKMKMKQGTDPKKPKRKVKWYKSYDDKKNVYMKGGKVSMGKGGNKTIPLDKQPFNLPTQKKNTKPNYTRTKKTPNQY